MIPLEILVADRLRLLPRLEVQFFHHEGRGAVRVAMGGESLFDSDRTKQADDDNEWRQGERMRATSYECTATSTSLSI
jgi:hypothetical protein